MVKEMTNRTSVLITDRQKNWMDHSGYSYSKIVRIALDRYIEYKEDVITPLKEVVIKLNRTVIIRHPEDYIEKYSELRNFINDNTSTVADMFYDLYIKYCKDGKMDPKITEQSFEKMSNLLDSMEQAEEGDKYC